MYKAGDHVFYPKGGVFVIEKECDKKIGGNSITFFDLISNDGKTIGVLDVRRQPRSPIERHHLFPRSHLDSIGRTTTTQKNQIANYARTTDVEAYNPESSITDYFASQAQGILVDNALDVGKNLIQSMKAELEQWQGSVIKSMNGADYSN